jgi:hypothetical protein
MEVTEVPLKEIKVDSPAKELANSEEAQPCLDCFKKASRSAELSPGEQRNSRLTGTGRRPAQ